MRTVGEPPRTTLVEKFLRFLGVRDGNGWRPLRTEEERPHQGWDI